MSLFYTSLITGLFLSIIGFLLLFPRSKFHSLVTDFPRSRLLSVTFVSIATIWFLWKHVAFLSEADFGEYKLLIGSIALATALLSFYFVPDFLAVRGLAMILLLWSREVLDAAFLHASYNRLVLVSVIYLIILAALYFGAWPYKMRDFIGWLYKETLRVRTLGSALSTLGLFITILSFTYS